MMDFPRLVSHVTRQGYNAFIAPYQEGSRHCRIACARSRSAMTDLAEATLFYRPHGRPTKLQRVAHLSLGIALCIPIVNIVVYLACKILSRERTAAWRARTPDMAAEEPFPMPPSPRPSAPVPSFPSTTPSTTLPVDPLIALRADPTPANIDRFVNTASASVLHTTLLREPRLLITLMLCSTEVTTATGQSVQITYPDSVDKIFNTTDATFAPLFAFRDEASQMTLMHAAVGQSNIQLVERLLLKAMFPAGVLGARDAHGQTPLHYAISDSSPEMVRLLCGYIAGNPAAHSTLNAQDHFGRNILHCAVTKERHLQSMWGYEANMIDLLDSLFERDGAGQTPLHHAASHADNCNIIDVLLDVWPAKAKAALTMADRQGRTPLACAEQVGCAKNIALLRKKTPAASAHGVA